MTVKGLSVTHPSVVTKSVGRPSGSSIGYSGRNPKGHYIINYHRDSVNIHKGQSVLRQLFGR